MRIFHQPILATIALIVLGGANHCLAATYELHINQDFPETGNLRLVLDEPLESDRAFVTRSSGAIHVRSPRCENAESLLQRNGDQWIAPAGCSVITWTTAFTRLSQPTFNVSAQTNQYHQSGWWLFAEWGNLLRPVDGDGIAEICAEVAATTTCRAVPATSEAPLLMLVGEPQERTVVGDSRVRFFSGFLPDGFATSELYAAYRQQLDYLHGVLGGHIGQPLPELIDVLVVGIDASQGVTGGAAGHSSLLANVVLSGGRIEASEWNRLLWISGHELAHVMGLGTPALWASESLAHYYGYKSVEDREGIAELFQSMADMPSPIGLLEAHRRVTVHGASQYYGLFYSRGAAFWRAMDQAISSATAGQRSLDEFLPMLVGGEYGSDGALPHRFVAAVESVVGTDRVQQILERYL